jgi:hypothetical protein
MTIHAGCKHVAVVAIGSDDLVALFQRHLHADDHRFLADIKVAEPAHEAHAVELAGFLLETADEQHVPIGFHLLFSGQVALFRLQSVVAFEFGGLAGHIGGFDGHDASASCACLRQDIAPEARGNGRIVELTRFQFIPRS